jgi:hypothetical protein
MVGLLTPDTDARPRPVGALASMNPTDKQVSYFLWVAGNAAEVGSPPHSIQTLVF